MGPTAPVAMAKSSSKESSIDALKRCFLLFLRGKRKREGTETLAPLLRGKLPALPRGAAAVVCCATRHTREGLFFTQIYVLYKLLATEHILDLQRKLPNQQIFDFPFHASDDKIIKTMAAAAATVLVLLQFNAYGTYTAPL